MNAHSRNATASQDLEARLMAIGAERYHDKHPFHHKLHSGQCTPDQVRAWVINRWAYQAAIPMKDAAFLSRCSDPQMRREWRSRIEDHDGDIDAGGGIRRWLKLAEAVGLDPDYVASGRGVLPATQFAVDAYIRYVRDMPLLEAVASSLTELFAPSIHERRIEGMLQHYDFANAESMSYFKKRLTEAPKDVKFGLAWVLDHADTPEKQDAACGALIFKTNVLWAQLDALWGAYVEPGRIPPGAWQPGEGMA
ncbi:pyrroloquinoline-quinone synthase PqqC [Shimia thalassica]|uniref:Pyrroloquinoline-quinone synthase n=1 Tax=Shimia thalassica TaxID=1715693 RepID=A0A0P1IFY7_9RHOB|nr:pyrroloquinoline-quinone synthase PqqC [Shimia thalassica]PHO05234.1 pyrroloquinoline quinone biosynthesis protein PqqC [Rhodobacteraceae bacterium 4F10]MDO6485644.1 pyrroloquinoline-quinone synthase PqqC [Shimia thalassica]MDO6800137.1 pyrroloquinoline-quinone synthase PqqC [Shimia thalassica]MDP2496044.1 pyrroloquinoline-quinone synthase PqqC [Shimia thalassica]MDP2519759.1 pyrroloquinoline-quinone synthase PqqC [Shimia thalassica]